MKLKKKGIDQSTDRSHKQVEKSGTPDNTTHQLNRPLDVGVVVPVRRGKGDEEEPRCLGRVPKMLAHRVRQQPRAVCFQVEGPTAQQNPRLLRLLLAIATTGGRFTAAAAAGAGKLWMVGRQTIRLARRAPDFD